MANPAPWYSDGLRFSCTRCGNCCSGPPGYVWVSAREIAEIAEALGLSAEAFRRQHTRSAGSRRSLLEYRNGDCEFLERQADGKTACRIHTTRPAQCRTWPFWKSNLEGPASWEAVGRTCPGLNQGRLHPLPVIQAELRKCAGRPL